MAEHPNVALLKRGYDAFGKGDMATLAELFAPDVVWHNGGRSQIAGDSKGQEEVFAFFGRLMEVAKDFRMDIHDVLANDEHCAVLVRTSFTGQGGPYEGIETHVFHLKDGKVTEFWAFPFDMYAQDAAMG